MGRSVGRTMACFLLQVSGKPSFGVCPSEGCLARFAPGQEVWARDLGGSEKMVEGHHHSIQGETQHS